LSSQFSANPPGRQTGPGATGGGQEASAGAPVTSGAVPALADCFTPRPQSGPGSLDSLAPGQWLTLTTAPGSPGAAGGPGGPARAAQVRDWPGGTGKTQLAVHLAQTWRKESPDGVLVWLAAATRDSALSGYRQATLERSGMVPLEDAETTATRFLAWLAETRQPWLLVLDGVSDPAELDGLWPAGPAGRVLVTAADDLAVAGSRNALVFPVGPFSPHEALAYLTTRLSADPDQRLGAVDLVQELSCDPLALAQASATIASSGVNCRDYREIFATRREQIAEASGEQPAAKAVTWTLAMECADELAPGGGAQLCLALAMLLGCQGIPEAVFSADAAAEFIAGPGTGAGGAGRARAALLSLQRTGLLTIDPGITGRLVRVHPAVQAGVRSAMPDSMRDRAALAAAAALLQTWPDQAEQSPSACSLRACVTSLDEAAGDVLWAGEAHQVLLRVGQSLDSGRLTRPAVRHWRAVAETSERVLGPAHPDTLLAGSRLASATLAAGDGAEAAALYQRFLDAQAGVLGPGHPRVAAARAEFGNALLRMGQPAEAIIVLEAALAAGERDRGAVDVLAIKDSLAAAYQAAGRYQDATRTALATLVERERSQGPDHREALATQRNLARAYLAAGKPKDAITYCRRALEGAERALGPDDPDTMDTVSVLASAYHSVRRLKDAIPLYEQALSDRERVQGPDDPDTIGARGNLASAYHSAGRIASAVELYERTRADCQRVLGPDHPDTLATRANLAHAYYTMGRISEASKMLESALADCERVLAPGDPLTVAVRESLEAVSDA
jgi:tetratricopeptide (TPR) repeat protein